MLIGSIVLKLRVANTRFENRIGGSAELDIALKNTLQREMAFVIPVSEVPNENTYDTSINQVVKEKFGVVVALQNDSSFADKTGITAYDSLHLVRAELFACLLGWLMPDAESLVSYGGGRIVGFDRAYLWYQFDFVTSFRIEILVTQGETDWLNSIYAQYVMSPSIHLPIYEGLPVTTFSPDMETIIDFTTNPLVDGGFDCGFDVGFDVYHPERG